MDRPPPSPRAVDTARLRALERALDGAALWGLEIDLRYRVLGATFEVPPPVHPDSEVGDPRLQILLFPVGEVKASLRREDREGSVHVETFTPDQLVDVVDSFGGAPVSAPLFNQPDPSGSWPPELSLQGSTVAADGFSHSLTVQLEGEGGRRFGLRATFDAVRVHDARGGEVPLTRFA